MAHSQWKQIIIQHLGQRHGKRSWSLMLDLGSVDCGLKPALLLDFAVPSAACVTSLLDALKSAALLTNPLTVVTVEVDVLIINPASFGDPDQSFPGVLFVDVSGHLEHPQLMSESSVLLQQTKNSFSRARERMMDRVSSVDVPVHVQSEQRVNPSTLFGLFLGYPVVYCYRMTQDSRHNCLSMVPLVNFVLKGVVPETAERRQSSREHVVCSFTVPQRLVTAAESRVEAWFREKTDNVQCPMFQKLELERRVVQLPTVCL